MRKFIICTIICVTIIDRVVNGFDLQCYQCDHVTEECEDNKASIIKCADSSTAQCSRQVKKDSLDKTRAIRKCVVPDRSGHVNCPVGYECFNCNTNLCNSNPVITSTTSSPSAATIERFIWSTLVASIFVAFYL